MGCGGSKKVTKTAPEPAATTHKLKANHSNNEDIRDKYDIGAILGSGSFGQVRQAVVRGAPVTEVRAVKMIERDNEDGDWSNKAIFVREVGLLQTLQHPNIIRYYDFYEDVHFLYVVMEICKGGEVFAKIVELKRFSEKDAARLGHQMLDAIAYIHRMMIAHRDIKAENFMLSQPDISSEVKMIDFGMACKFQEGEVLTELCGSPHYLAPELIGQKYDNRADIWAFGVLLYLIMYGHYPYDASNPSDIMVKVMTKPIRWQTKAVLTPNALDFLKKLLEHDPRKRMMPQEALQHPWMKLATDKSSGEGEIIATDVLRSAHRKVTASRKSIDPKIDQLRNQKLHQIEEDFKKGVRHGQRLGATPKEEYMSKPEFLRRDNKITTAPSREMNKRRTSIQKMLGMGASATAPGDRPGNSLGAIGEKDDSPVSPASPPRSMSLSPNSKPRRLSYIGALAAGKEKQLAEMYTILPTIAAPDNANEEEEAEDDDK